MLDLLYVFLKAKRKTGAYKTCLKEELLHLVAYNCSTLYIFVKMLREKKSHIEIQSFMFK